MSLPDYNKIGLEDIPALREEAEKRFEEARERYKECPVPQLWRSVQFAHSDLQMLEKREKELKELTALQGGKRKFHARGEELEQLIEKYEDDLARLDINISVPYITDDLVYVNRVLSVVAEAVSDEQKLFAISVLDGNHQPCGWDYDFHDNASARFPDFDVPFEAGGIRFFYDKENDEFSFID